MTSPIKGLHHVTLLASGAQENNDFFTQVLGQRRVKKTVNFDRPEVYHLYYGDTVGTPGGVITYFPFPGSARGRHGAGEVGETVYSIPTGALSYWRDRLENLDVKDIAETARFGDSLLRFWGPDGEVLALVEAAGDPRSFWTGAGIPEEHAIRGFHSVALHVSDAEPMAELLDLMGYELAGKDGAHRRYAVPDGNGANVVDLLAKPDGEPAQQGAGSVHHVAFAVADRAAQLTMRGSLVDAGFQVTEVIDRDYFWAIYFRTPGGILFEVATDEPGFDRDEDIANLGTALKLPSQHAHLRASLEDSLPPLAD